MEKGSFEEDFFSPAFFIFFGQRENTSMSKYRTHVHTEFLSREKIEEKKIVVKRIFLEES